MSAMRNEVIANGQYVIFQKNDFKKLNLLCEKNSSVTIGKDKVEFISALGQKLGSTFKMVPKPGLSRQFTLQLCSVNDMTCTRKSLKDLGKFSGLDNRSICDDGSSQSLTSNSIEELRDNGLTPNAIIEQLVENSKTFQIKTEYSQQKYINKKEKKYFEFITVRQPTIRLLADIFNNLGIPKSIGLRVDTLSQLTSALNYQPDGNYLLVESGFCGIVAATLLHALSDAGKLIHVTPGTQNQKQAVLAMNFSSSRMSQLMTVRLSTLMEFVKKTNTESRTKSCSNFQTESENAKKDPANLLLINNSGDNNLPHPEIDVTRTTEILNGTAPCSEMTICSSVSVLRKRKYSIGTSESSEPTTLKKPRWAVEAGLAVEVMVKKVDGLMIACKEFPLDILDQLLDYVLPSRPFVVYSLYQEPLVAMYLKLKPRHDVLCLRITETWLRPYQILPERSHPAVTMTSSSGYLLSGIKVAN